MSTSSRDAVPGTTVLVGLAFVLIVLATLTPSQPYSGLNPIATRPPRGLAGLIDLAGNVALFLPLGVALAARGVGFVSLVAVGLAASTAVESAQVVVPGRYPALADLVTNTTGTALGGLVYTLARGPTGAVLRFLLQGLSYLTHPGARSRPWLIAGGTALPAIAAAVGALLALPVPHAGAVYVAPVAIDPTDRLYVGSDRAGGSFCGLVDEVRIYSRALSASELALDRDRPAKAGAAGPGLVAAYDFDETQGAPMDVSGGGMASRLEGAERTPNGRFGSALRLGHANARLSIGPSAALDAGRALTVSAWVHPETAACGSSILDSSGSAYYLHTGPQQHPLRPFGGGRFASTYETVLSAALIPGGLWSHLALTYDGERLQLYVDAEMQAVKVFGARALDHVEADGRSAVPGEPLPAGAWPWDASRPLTVVLDGRELAIPSARRPLLRLMASDCREALAVEGTGSTLRVRYRPRFQRFGASPVEYRLSDALRRPSGGGSVRVQVGGSRLRGWVRIDEAAPQAVGLTPAGWWTRFMYAQEIPALWRWIGTLVAAAAMSLPLGSYARGTRWGPLWVVAPFPALLLVVALGQMMGPPASEVGSMAVGFGAGWWLRRGGS